MERRSIEELEAETHTFFARHWPAESGPAPRWREPWCFQGAIPGGDLPGCYVLIGEDGLVWYVGSGASAGGGSYPEFGIGRRLNRIWTTDPEDEGPVADRHYLRADAYKWVKEARAIPFPTEAFYLAPALEAYLILKLDPPKNTVGRARARPASAPAGA